MILLLRSDTFNSVVHMQKALFQCRLVTNYCKISQSMSFYYPRDAMLAWVIAIATCPSVRLSVRLSVCHAPVLCQNEES